MGNKKAGPSVLIGIPNRSGWCHETVALSRLALLNRTKDALPAAELHCNLTGPDDIAQGRWELAQSAVEMGADYLFFLDSDMMVPDFTLIAMLQMNVDIVTGLGFTNHAARPVPSIYLRLPEKERADLDKPYTPLFFYHQSPKPVLEVDACGMHCCLIKTDVFHKIAEAHNSMIEWFNPFARNGCGEDFSFCRRAQDVGYKIYARLDIKCGHFPRWPRTIDEDFYLSNFDPGKYGMVYVDESFDPTERIPHGPDI